MSQFIERFWRKVHKTDGCWEWQAALNESGYGVLQARQYSTRVVRAHRLAWEITNGPIPRGLFVCHKCDNRACVRPDHLFLGTNRDNLKDMVRKGRHNHGERVPNAGLTNNEANRVVQLHLMCLPQPEIARLLGVSIHSVRTLLKGKTWKHLEPTNLPKKGDIREPINQSRPTRFTGPL